MTLEQALAQLGRKLWEVDGPEENQVSKVGVVMARHGLLLPYHKYERGTFDIYRPVITSIDPQEQTRAAIKYIKQTGG